MSKEKKAFKQTILPSVDKNNLSKRSNSNILARFGYTLYADFKRNKRIYLLLVPVITYFVLFHYLPMAGIVIAFKRFEVRGGVWNSPWVGLDNFIRYVRSYYFGRLIRNTFALSILNILFGFPAPIILALLLNEIRSRKFKRTVQTVTYLPHFISVVVVCGMIIDFFSPNGLINSILGTNISFLLRPQYFRALYIGSEIWQEAGWGSIIYLAALTAINPEMYESASIDGAGRFRQMLYITLPCLIPTIAVLLLLRIGRVMSVGADKVLLLYNPGTYETADIISTFVYRKGLLEADYSYSAAVDLINSVINCTLLVIANKLAKFYSSSSLW
jgi:putative aldouronate transport system permease protein